MHMRTTREFTGIQDKTVLIYAGLRQPIERVAARRLIALGGTMPELGGVRRRKPLKAS